jgi:hypothetical protein
MTNLKDQIEENIRNERERSEKPGQSQHKDADEARSRLDGIRPRLDELSHTTDTYRRGRSVRRLAVQSRIGKSPTILVGSRLNTNGSLIPTTYSSI